MPVAEKVVGELHALRHAGLVAAIEHLAEHLERRADRFDLFLRAGNHHRQRALLGAGNAAGHRAVDLHDVALLQDLGGPDRGARAGGREIDVAADAVAADQAVVAGRDLQADIERGETRHHGLDPVGHVGRRLRRGGAELEQGLHCRRAGVEHRELVAGLDQAAAHRAAHAAETDKSDFHSNPPNAPALSSAIGGESARPKRGRHLSLEVELESRIAGPFDTGNCCKSSIFGYNKLTYYILKWWQPDRETEHPKLGNPSPYQ